MPTHYRSDQAPPVLRLTILLVGMLLASPLLAQCFESSSWTQADQLFQNDQQWVGADGAFSIELNDDRTLWLFADTWVDPSGQRSRKNGRMIRNSVAIQTGTDPSNASIEYFWDESDSDHPRSFFSRDDDKWYWPGHGVRVGDRLIIFLNRVRGTDTGLGFDSDGWNAVMISNPDDAPTSWDVQSIATPTNRLGIITGFAGVLRWREHVYAFGSENPDKSHPIFAARWTVEEFMQGNLMAPEWWAGVDHGWVPDESSSPRLPIFGNGQSEQTIHFDKESQQFIAIHTQGFGKADLMIRVAPDLTGPWSEPRKLFSPPENHEPNIMIYAAKSHPQLTGADLVLTYATNTFDFGEHFSNPLSYYPHFVRLSRCNGPQ